MAKKKEKNKIYNLQANDDLEKIEEDIIEAANKAGKRNVIVNIFSYPQQKLKKRWNVRYKFNKKHLLLDLIIAGAVLVLIGLNIFWLWGGFHYFFNKMDLDIETSTQEVISGDDVIFNIKYNNRNKFELEEVVLSFEYPQYFELKSVSREDYDYEHNLIKLGDLAPGANGMIEIEGRIFGSLDEHQAVYAFANFYKTNKKGDRLWGTFRRNSIYEYEIEGSLLQVESSLPEKLVNNQIFDWPIKITNQSEDITYERVELKPEFNEYIIEIDKDDRILENFKPGEVAEFTVRARIKTEAKKRNMSFELFWERENWVLKQASWSKDQIIVDPEFKVTHTVEKAGAVDPGSWVDLKLTYLNGGEFSLEDVQLELALIGGYWDLYNIKKESGQLEKNKLVWTSEDLPRLELLQPGEGGEITLSVKTREYVAGSSDINLQSQAGTKYRFNEQEAIIDGDVISTRLNSNLTYTAYPMYYAATGDQLGRGPLPPRVGETTKYWVFVKLINDISPVEDVSVSLQLPTNVSWNNRSSVPVGNPLVYDAATKTVTWQISKVPVKPGRIGFAFEVGIIPSANQVGKYPVLAQNMKINGKDSNTGEKIEKELGAITTKLNQDTKGKLRDDVVR